VHRRSPKYTVVEMTGPSTGVHTQVSVIGSGISKPHHQSCSNLIEDQQVSGQTSNASPESSFILSNQSLDRTSPEGRSCGGLDPDAIVCLEEDEQSDGACQAEGGQLTVNDGNERGLEEITSISSYFNFQTPTSHLSQSKHSQPEEKTGDMFGEIGLRFIDSSAVEEDIEGRGEETSVSSFSTFYTPTSQEDVSWGGEDKTRDKEDNVDLGKNICKQVEIQTKYYVQTNNKEESTKTDCEKGKNDEILIDKTSLCSFHTTVSNLNQDQNISNQSTSSGEEWKENDQPGKSNFSRHVHQATVEKAEDNTSLASFCSFRTPLSNLSLDKTFSCSDDEQTNLTLRQSEFKENQLNKDSISSFYNFFTPLSGLSIDGDEDIADIEDKARKVWQRRSRQTISLFKIHSKT
jgi:hypothetical protein